MPDLNKIVIEGKIMLRFTENVISLWIEGLPRDVHFSLSLNKDKPDINLHLTREVNNPGNKPKSEVFVLAKDFCNDWGYGLWQYVFDKTLKEFDVTKLNSVVIPKFICNDSMKESNFYKSIEHQLTPWTSNFIKYKGKREVRVNKNVVEELENLKVDELAFTELYNTAPEINDVTSENMQIGIIISHQEVYSAVHCNRTWYTPNKSFSTNDLLKYICGEKQLKISYYRLKKSIAIIRNAQSYNEIKHLLSEFRITKPN